MYDSKSLADIKASIEKLRDEVVLKAHLGELETRHSFLHPDLHIQEHYMLVGTMLHKKLHSRNSHSYDITNRANYKAKVNVSCLYLLATHQPLQSIYLQPDQEKRLLEPGSGYPYNE